MQAIRSLLRANPQLIRNAVQQRNMSPIAVPPRKKMPQGEVVVLATLMAGSWLFIPGWVLVNTKHYRSH